MNKIYLNVIKAYGTHHGKRKKNVHNMLIASLKYDKRARNSM